MHGIACTVNHITIDFKHGELVG